MDDLGTSHVPDAPLPPTEFTRELRDGMFTLLEVACAFQGSGLHLLDLMLIGTKRRSPSEPRHGPSSA